VEKYEIVLEKAVNNGPIVRKEFKVVVKPGLTKGDYEAIGDEIVGRLKAGNCRAAIIWFYFEGDGVDGAFTAARVEWGPDGDWGKADVGTDCDNYRVSTKVLRTRSISDILDLTVRDVAKEFGIPIEFLRKAPPPVKALKITLEISLDKRKEIYYHIVQEEDRLHGQANNVARAAENVAQKYGVPVDQIKTIGWEGVERNWPDPPIKS